jgi:endonuclease YncB( thermonuclease family)
VEAVDYAGQLKLNMNSSTLKMEVTVKAYVDGDTVHFNVPSDVMPGGVLKARFLAINTPESTGKIEEYGKAASNFTKETLMAAESIIIESDTDSWNADSTGGRYLVWVWYKTAEMSDYRNLNIEILQNGLAIASNSGGNIYGDTALAALAQAKAQKLNVHSGKPDPDFFYGEAVELDLKELRSNVANYNGMKVAFTGVVTVNSNSSVYVETYDSETDMYYGMSVYYGYGLTGEGLKILDVGNEVRIVGTVQYYETGGTWQVSGLTYRAMRPNDPSNIQKLSEGHEPSYVLTDPARFANGTVDVVVDETITTLPYAQLAMSTSVRMEGLYVKDVYTTNNEESSSNGAMTLTCEIDGVTIYIRTVVLLDESGNLITADAYLGKTIDVRGIVDSFDGDYQIKVFSRNDIVVQ